MSEVNVTIFDRNYRLAVTTGEEKIRECIPILGQMIKEYIQHK